MWDEASHLYYLRARHYNPALGRFMTRDPFAGLVQVPQTLHPYVYVGNNPVNLTDPSGQFAPLVLVGIGAGSFVVGGGVAAWNYRQANPCSDLLHDPAFWEAVLRGGAIGVVGSVTAALVFTVMPVGCLGAAIQAGVVSGIFGGGAAQVTANVLDEQPLYYGLDRAVVSGGLTGGVLGGASHGLSSISVRRLPTRPADSPYYEVFFEAQLQEGTHFPGKTRYVHFREANRQLNEVFQADPAFATRMEQMFPDIADRLVSESPGGIRGYAPSAKLTWHHHANREGVLQLIPRSDNAFGSPVWDILHPDNRGGFSNW